MIIGELVKRCEWLWPDNSDCGIVLSVEPWVDKGAPDRNFGITVKVLWSTGFIESCEEADLKSIEY